MGLVDNNWMQEYSTKLWNKTKLWLGSPLKAATVAEMTDTTKIYVYTGSEAGYTAGNWYYHNGSAWTSGGVYNSVAVSTDTDLVNAGEAADAKATGDRLSAAERGLLGVSKINVTEYEGYYNTNGTTSSPTSAGQEKYTNRIPINEGEKIRFEFDISTIGKQWACYCIWRKNGTCLGRTVFEDSANNKTHYSIEVTAPAEAYEISFNYRTWGIEYQATITYASSLHDKVLSAERSLADYAFLTTELHDTFEIGSLHPTTGDYYESTTYVRNNNYIYMPPGTTLTFHPIANNTVYDFILYPFDKDLNLLRDKMTTTWVQSYSRTYPVPEGAVYMKLVIRYDDSHTMASSDPAVFAEAVSFNVIAGEQAVAEDVRDAKALAGYKRLPSYWETYLAEKKPAIVEAINSVGSHGDYFAFFTDYHVTTNTKHTAAICKWLASVPHLDKVICGGDILKTHTHDAALALLQEYRDDFDGVNLLTLYGNHDGNTYASGEELAFDEVYNSLFKRNELTADLDMAPGGYFAVTNKTQKIEYIFLDTGDIQRDIVDDQAQYEWLFDRLNAVPDGWYVVVFAHMLYEISGGSPQDAIAIEFIKAVLDAYQNKTSGSYASAIQFDFSAAHGKVAALIGGHIHIDYTTDSEAGYPIILTTCDSRGEDTTLTRTLGTTLEHAIDLFFIDTEAKTIEAIRLGAGSDRSFTFS